jgi:hypothetical protein
MITLTYGGVLVKFHCEHKELRSTHVIYLLKFPNGKYYVGQTNTKFGLLSRIQSHCYESKNKSKKRNIYKDNIINKYKTFDVFILKRCTLKNIDDFEIFYINILKRKLVNIENGGCLNKTITVETLKKISEKVRKYNKLNPKQIKINVYDLEGNYVRSHKTINEAKEFYNVTSTVVSNALYKENRKFIGKYQIFREGTEKIINYNKKERKINKRKANNLDELVYKYDSKTGKFIESFAIGKTNSNERYYIKLAIKRNSLYNNFAWSYDKKEKIIPPKSQYAKTSEKLSKPILQLNDNLEIIKKWKNAKEAGEYYNVRPELIRQVCIRWRKHTKGFVWCYENEYEWYKTMWGEKLVRKR